MLARLDASKLDLNNPRVHRQDRDFAAAWARNYGKGRVFYSTFGHTDVARGDEMSDGNDECGRDSTSSGSFPARFAG
jgi:hypothetical protein